MYLVIVFLFPTYENIIISIIDAIKSAKLFTNSPEKLSGVIIAPTPSIKNEFNIQEPIRFPNANPCSPFTLAIIEVISSGKAVPIATIVSPITLSEIPYIAAILLASSNTISPPYFSNIAPIIIV